MSDTDGLGSLLGYQVKLVDAHVRAQMDQRLRPLGVTVAQYACMALLDERSDISAAELARGAFVSRQAMHTLLQGLAGRGIVDLDATRAGRAIPATLTPEGAALYGRCRAEIAEVEAATFGVLAPRQRSELLGMLRAVLASSSS